MAAVLMVATVWVYLTNVLSLTGTNPKQISCHFNSSNCKTYFVLTIRLDENLNKIQEGKYMSSVNLI